MRRHIISLLTFIALINLLHSSDILLDEIILKTNEEFEKVSKQWTDINGNTWRQFPNGSIQWWNGTDWQ